MSGTKKKAITWGAVVTLVGVIAGIAYPVVAAIQSSGGLATQNDLKVVREQIDRDFARKEAVVPRLERIEGKLDTLLLSRWNIE